MIGVEYFRPVFDENGNEIGEQKVDKEAEKKQREEEQKKLAEDSADPEVDEEFMIECDTVGMSESALAADKKNEEEEKEKKKELAKKFATISKNPDEEQKRAQLAALLQASETTETSVSYTA